MHIVGFIFCAVVLFALAALCFASRLIDRRYRFAPDKPQLLPRIAGAIFALLGVCLLLAPLLGLHAIAAALFAGALVLLVLVWWNM